MMTGQTAIMGVSANVIPPAVSKPARRIVDEDAYREAMMRDPAAKGPGVPKSIKEGNGGREKVERRNRRLTIIMRLIKVRGEMTASDITNALGVSLSVARNDIRGLISQKRIVGRMVPGSGGAKAWRAAE